METTSPFCLRREVETPRRSSACFSPTPSRRGRTEGSAGHALPLFDLLGKELAQDEAACLCRENKKVLSGCLCHAGHPRSTGAPRPQTRLDHVSSVGSPARRAVRRRRLGADSVLALRVDMRSVVPSPDCARSPFLSKGRRPSSQRGPHQGPLGGFPAPPRAPVQLGRLCPAPERVPLGSSPCLPLSP